MKKSIYTLLFCLMAFFVLMADSCNMPSTGSADQIDQENQAKIQKEGQAQSGMPTIHNFTEKKMIKMLYELRDNPNLVNYAYLWSEVSGKWVFLGKCVGYGMPYATQYSNPEQDTYYSTNSSVHNNLPQAEPNGLYMPSSAEGTWLMLINPNNESDVKPVYVEPRCIVSPFRLPNQ